MAGVEVPCSPLSFIEMIKQGLPERLVLASLLALALALAERRFLFRLIDLYLRSLRPEQQAKGH